MHGQCLCLDEPPVKDHIHPEDFWGYVGTASSRDPKQEILLQDSHGDSGSLDNLIWELSGKGGSRILLFALHHVEDLSWKLLLGLFGCFPLVPLWGPGAD